ncbi:hypothetical protein LIER_15972 [Lithospermum erythrorhizon]|uniref:Uncharacterized protein n=1 Tax=Lithospermum erythrorhizon TaxID=34254 RepID=A0AAV3Q5U5_LITER
MNSNGNDNHPQENDTLNLNNPHGGRNEDAQLNPQEPYWCHGRIEGAPPTAEPDAPAISSSIREEREETHTHTPPSVKRHRHQVWREMLLYQRLYPRCRRK